MNNNTDKWEEKFFQTILAITTGMCANPKTTNPCSLATKPIIEKAKRIMESFQAQVQLHYSNNGEECEN